MAEGGPRPGSEWFRQVSGNHHVAKAGAERREKFLRVLAETGSKAEALAEAGVQNNTYLKWRDRHKGFAARADAAKGMAKSSMIGTWDGSFVEFRKAFFGMDSPHFHLEMIKAIEATKPGEITLILLPPEHGKTTLMEDYCGYKLALDPSYRIMVGSGKQAHSKKVLRRVRRRMESDGPVPRYVARFGPFSPQKGGEGRAHSQPWGETHFDVWKKGGNEEDDERDYSMVALGIGGDVVGSRTDNLLIDDVQALKTLSQTDKLIEFMRQDWFSRPGSKGITVLVGTRVGDQDVYHELMELGLVDHLVVFPAINHRGQYLWPERYSPEEYTVMRKKVGESAWARNYQQDPLTDGAGTFEVEAIEACHNELRSVAYGDMSTGQRKMLPPGVTEVVISMDPGFGRNVVTACGISADKLYVLEQCVNEGLRSTEQMFNIIDELCWAYSPVGVVTIEDKAFQKGLQTDGTLIEMQRRWGFQITGHQTGESKIDEDIGIPAMARSFRQQQIDLPAAEDEATQAQLKMLTNELVRWKPGVKGTKLRQDMVMALWFGWLIWRNRRHYDRVDTQSFSFQGLPWGTTHTGLTIPRKGILSR